MATGVQRITIDGIQIDVQLKKIRNMHLYVTPPEGAVRVSVPHRMDMEKVRGYLYSKLAWIKKHQARFQSSKAPVSPAFTSGERHLFEGRDLLLNVINHNGPPKVELSNDAISLYIRAGAGLQSRRSALAAWHRDQLKKRIPAFIERWSSAIGVEVTHWGIRQMKTRWGSCSVRARRIWINIEFAKKGDDFLDYIIVHELAHLIEPGHNARFKALMDRYQPGWREIKAALNRSTFQ